MLTAIKQRIARDDEKGFTLIELMVVVLIIAILLAIAIPTFLGARNTANARSAQSNDRNALTAEQTEWTNGQSFSQDKVTMSGIEQALNWVSTSTAAAAPAATHDVGVAVGDADSSGNFQAVEIEAYGKDGNCWYILQSNDPANSFTDYAGVKQSSTHTCPVPAVPTALPTSLGTGGAAGNLEAAGANPTTWYASF